MLILSVYHKYRKKKVWSKKSYLDGAASATDEINIIFFYITNEECSLYKIVEELLYILICAMSIISSF